ncbi:MAG TPA: isochorismatase family protein [Acidimicrobiia bacterium]|nr:isochorismatase family protein [Acidimicrobiia bacterium]
MPTLDRSRSVLCLIDFQERLMPAIDGGGDVVANAARLLGAAEALGVPVVMTEQNPKGLGATVPELARPDDAVPVVSKMEFDACRARGVIDALPAGHHIVVAGCEAHVCVLQTVLGLIDRSRRAYVVADAVGSRRPESKAAALARLERAGAEVVTTEMVLFEWLGTADDPAFKSVIALVK